MRVGGAGGATDEDLRDEGAGPEECTDSGRTGEGIDWGRELEGVNGAGDWDGGKEGGAGGG